MSRRERIKETLDYLQGKFTGFYDEGLPTKIYGESIDSSEVQYQRLGSRSESPTTSGLENNSEEEKATSEGGDSTSLSQTHFRKTRFEEGFRKTRVLKKDRYVLVCKVDFDCILKSHKPLFYLPKSEPITKRESVDLKKYEDSDEEDTILTPKDIQDINYAIQCVISLASLYLFE